MSLLNESPVKFVVVSALLGLTMKWLFFGRPNNKKLRYPQAKSYLTEDESVKVMTEVFDNLQANFEKRVTHQIQDKGRWDYEWRIQQLYGLMDFAEEHAEEIFQAAHKDIGRTRSEMILDMGGLKSDLLLLIRNLKHWMKPVPADTPLWMLPGYSYIQHEPLGVVLVLGTWNYATLLCILPIAGAIAAGNAVVLSPSEVAPAQGELLARLLPQYIDPEALTVLPGGPKVSKSLVDNHAWGKVFYTGGCNVGAMIGASCASRLIPCALELGGKSPTIVLPDADLKVACRRIVQGKYVNSGQTCIATDYVIVVGTEQQQKVVTEALVAEIKRAYPGDVKSNKEYARIVNDRHFSRVQSLLSGGKIIHGGKSDASQKFIEPTVLVDCDLKHPLMTDEIFGPLMPLIYASTVDEAIQFVRSKAKPLALYVFSSSSKNINQILARTTSGSACVNETVFQYLNSNLPFGGVGNSGVGSYHGKASVLEFSHARSVLVKWTFGDLPIRYLPYIGQDWVQKLFLFLMTM